MTETFMKIAQQIANAGGRLYLVGGAVRDKMLEIENHDMDFCVTGLSVAEFEYLFPNARMQGKDFPVFIMNGCEFALARKERKIGEKHTDFQIETDKKITIEEDLARRDVTINAMALDVISDELIDPFDGKKDIENKMLRMTTEAFREDSLRVYRVARFAAQLGFNVDGHTMNVMNEMKKSLNNLSVERVCTEFRKALLTEKPSIFFNVLRDTNTLDVHFKEISDLIGVEQPNEYHPEGDVYNHTMEVLDRVTELTVGIAYHANSELLNTNQIELTRFCALVHDFGKASTPKEIWPHHYEHEEAGVPLIKEFCRRLKLPTVFEKAGIITSKYHMLAGRYNTLKPSTKIKMFEAIYASRSLTFEGLEIIAKCDSKNNDLHFAKIANEVMKVNATEEMKEKCGFIDGKQGDFEKLKQLIHQKRIDKLIGDCPQ